MTGAWRYGLIFCCSLWGTQLMSSDNPANRIAEQFCITEGRITRAENQWMRVDSTKMRAVLGWTGKPEAEIRFRYLGETEDRSLLRSGAERTQIGLKLKAQDDCNVLYVMWRVSPVSNLVVSVKSNPGQHRHAECGNSGYTNIRGTLKRADTKNGGGQRALTARHPGWNSSFGGCRWRSGVGRACGR